MSKLFYTGGAASPRTPLAQRPIPTYELHRTGTYRPDPGLVAAANVAILLGQPLLLTGEPGTGKTRFAYALAQDLNLGEVLECFVKSSTSAKDLFYSFDELGRFRDSQAGEDFPLQRYLSFNGLGKAILFAGGPGHALKTLPGRAFESHARRRRTSARSKNVVGWNAGAPRPQTFGDIYPADAFPSHAPCASVVLIDELDKAPRDAPNDMLNEIERLGFDIPELGLRVEVPRDAKTRPITVITSNSEKSLPDPFLRRCVYFDIPFPVEKALLDIVYAQVKWLGEAGTLLDEALQLFPKLRDRNRIHRPPGTAELLAWLDALENSGLQAEDSLRKTLKAALAADTALLETSLAALIKKPEDRNTAKEIIGNWANAST